MKIVFAGTPAFGLPCLEALATSPHQLQAIYTQPDRPAGRGRKLQASPVKEWAQNHQLPIYQPLNFKEDAAVNELAALAPDVLVVIAYGLILPRRVLELPRLGCINVHASLLPRWRGASPIQQAILHGDKESGVTIMQMDVGLDTGAMLMRASCDINNSTAGDLHDRLSQLAVMPLLATLEKLASGHASPEEQDNNLATYAPKITKEDAAINWHNPATAIDRQIRAFNPWPITYTQADDVTVRIYEATIIDQKHSATPGTVLSIDKNGMLVAAGEQALLVTRLQFPGGKAMTVADWLHAERHQLYVNQVLQ
jgi:methionyl-tRNA formyltransferase